MFGSMPIAYALNLTHARLTYYPILALKPALFEKRQLLDYGF